MCYGSGCRVSFSNCTFKRCSVVALCGSHVTVDNCTFAARADVAEGIAVYACGAGTLVHMTTVDISGGAQGVAVHGGACVFCSKLAVSHCFVTGVETMGESSSVDLSDCTISDFSRCYASCGVCAPPVASVASVHSCLLYTSPSPRD